MHDRCHACDGPHWTHGQVLTVTLSPCSRLVSALLCSVLLQSVSVRVPSRAASSSSSDDRMYNGDMPENQTGWDRARAFGVAGVGIFFTCLLTRDL